MSKKGTIKHLENKYSFAHYQLIKACEAKELRFYLYLKLYAINKSSAFPSYETIEKDLGWSEDQVRYLIKKMDKAGHLKYTPGSGRKSSVYDISWYDKVNIEGLEKSEVSKVRGQGLEKSNPRGGKSSGGTIRNRTNRNITNNSKYENKIKAINKGAIGAL